MDPARPRIAIVEDQTIVSEMVHEYLQRVLHCEIVAVSSTGAAAVSDIKRLRPEVVLLDLGLPDLPPKQLIEAVLTVADKTKVIAFTSLLNPVTLLLVEESNLHGYLDKWGDGVRRLQEAITTVREGRLYRPPGFREKLRAARAMRHGFVNVLTEREGAVLALIGDSLTDGQIGIKLGIADGTAHAYRTRIMGKVNCHSTPELIHYAIEKGFTVPDNATFRRLPPEGTAAQERWRKPA